MLRLADIISETDVHSLSLNNQRVVELNRLLHESELEKNEVLNLINEDLRKPLGIIQSMAHGLLQKGRDKSASDDTMLAMNIHRVATRLKESLGRLLEMEALIQGVARMRPHYVDVLKAIRKLRDDYAERAGRKGVELQVESPHDSVPVFIDSKTLTHVLESLIISAIKSTSRGGRIVLRVELEMGVDERARCLCLNVIDQGAETATASWSGMAAGKAYPASLLAESGNSSGPGFTIVRKLVAQMSGCIRYERQDEGQSAFIVRLPVDARDV